MGEETRRLERVVREGPPVRIDVPADLALLRLGVSMIRRALVNLLVNALQAAGEDGRGRREGVARGARRTPSTTKASGTGLGSAW